VHEDCFADIRPKERIGVALANAPNTVNGSFICLEDSTTGVFAFECAFSVRWSSLVHRLRLLIFLPVFAMKTPVLNASPATTRIIRSRIFRLHRPKLDAINFRNAFCSPRYTQ
jgi:hypothetical protein